MKTKIDVDRQFVFDPAVNILLRVELSGTASSDELKSAIEAVLPKYEILNCKISQDINGDFYYEPLDNPNEVEIIVENAIQPIESFIHNKNYQYFDLAEGKLCRFIIQRDSNHFYLNVILHHLAGDGKSALILLEDILDTLDSLVASFPALSSSHPKVPVKIFTKEYLNKLTSIKHQALPYASIISNEWLKSPTIFTLSDRKKLFDIYWSRFEFSSTSALIPLKKVNSLSLLCKKYKVT